jgi:outer membrane protein TolC
MAGKISFLDLENIEQNLVDARLNQLEYLKNANTRKLSVENLLGVGLGE